MKTSLPIRMLALLAISSFIFAQPLAAQRRGSVEPQKSPSSTTSTRADSKGGNDKSDSRTNEPAKNQTNYNQGGNNQNSYNQKDNNQNSYNQKGNNQNGYNQNNPNQKGYNQNDYRPNSNNGYYRDNRNDSYKNSYINAHDARCVYMRPPSPRDENRMKYDNRYYQRGYVWVDGYWDWDARMRAYYWVDGYWVRERAGYTFYPGYWEPARGGFIWIEGGWFTRG